MTSCSPKVSACLICFEQTKYICIGCGIPICNICGIPEMNEETRGWSASRSVGYCSVNCEKLQRISAERSEEEGQSFDVPMTARRLAGFHRACFMMSGNLCPYF